MAAADAGQEAGQRHEAVFQLGRGGPSLGEPGKARLEAGRAEIALQARVHGAQDLAQQAQVFALPGRGAQDGGSGEGHA